jgi:hypothetical protein
MAKTYSSTTSGGSIVLNFGSRKPAKKVYALFAIASVFAAFGLAWLLSIVSGLLASQETIWKGPKIFGFMCVMAVLVVYGLVVKSMLQNATEVETVTLSSQALHYLSKGLFKTEEFTEHLDSDTFIKLTDSLMSTEHPLAYGTGDVLGLGANERAIAQLNHTGSIELVTSTHIIRFGKNIPSWDAEAAIAEITASTGIKNVLPAPSPLDLEFLEH